MLKKVQISQNTSNDVALGGRSLKADIRKIRLFSHNR